MVSILPAVAAAVGAFFIWLAVRIVNRPGREFYDVVVTVMMPIGLTLIGVAVA
jgi:hypothetical protein